jgi:hypothetical protein
MCVHKLKHFQPHSLLCHLWCFFFYFVINSFFMWYFIWLYQKLTKQLRQTFFYNHIQFIFTLLINCINTTVLAELSLHHNIILDELDHSSVSRICTNITFSDSPITSLSYIIATNASILLLIHFFLFSYFFFFLPSFSYLIWSWPSLLAYSFLAFSYFFFFPSFSYLIWSWLSLVAYSFLSFSYFFFFFILLFNMKMHKSSCLFVSSIQLFLFFFFHSHI